MFYEGFLKFSLRRGLTAWLPLTAIAGLGMTWVAVSRDRGDEFAFSSWRERSRGQSVELRQSQIESVFEARLPGEYRTLSRALSRHLMNLSGKLDFEPAFVLALMEVESGFRPQVVSSAGAIGLLQLMPGTAAPLARKLKLSTRLYGGIRTALRDPFFNMTLGLHYLSQLRQRYAGMSPYWWMAAYNLGPTRLDALRTRGDFRPVATLSYFRKIRRRLSYFRHYPVTPKKSLARRGMTEGRPGHV